MEFWEFFGFIVIEWISFLLGAGQIIKIFKRFDNLICSQFFIFEQLESLFDSRVVDMLAEIFVVHSSILIYQIPSNESFDNLYLSFNKYFLLPIIDFIILHIKKSNSFITLAMSFRNNIDYFYSFLTLECYYYKKVLLWSP